MPFEMLSDKLKENKVKAFLEIETNRGMGITVRLDNESSRIVNDLLPANKGWDLDSQCKPVSFNLGYDKDSRQILIEVRKFLEGEYEGRYTCHYFFISKSLAKVIEYSKSCKYILINQEGNKLYFAPATLEDFLY